MVYQHTLVKNRDFTHWARPTDWFQGRMGEQTAQVSVKPD
jgi:hypothetical protein